MKYKMKLLIKKVFFSKYLFPFFRRLYFIKFKLQGGNGGFKAKKYLKVLNEHEFCSLDELESIQNRKLRKLIVNVYENVPFYREIMNNVGMIPSDIKTTNDLIAFPILTKEDIKNNLYNLVNNRYDPKKLISLNTSGTTGTPMKFFFSAHEISIRAAHIEWWKKIAGVNQFDRYMYIAFDDNVINNNVYSGTFTHEGFFCMATINLNDEMMWKYFKNIKKYKPVYLRGYASGCYILADFFKRNKIRYPLKAVMTSSDTLYPHQRKVIEASFECEVYDFYHQSEDNVIAFECNMHNGYHLVMESCYAEIIDENGNRVPEETTGMIVGTQLENYSMPLIRYETSDLGMITNEICVCGRKHKKIKKLFGRKDDFIYTPDGKKVSGLLLSRPFKKVEKEVREAQYIQKTKDTLIVHFVPTSKYCKDTENIFNQELRKFVGNKIALEFNKVDIIPKTMRGKHRLIISQIKE
jgi:phenylacetate-CoA ligase